MGTQCKKITINWAATLGKYATYNNLMEMP